jgi:L-rhamnose mutarotase
MAKQDLTKRQREADARRRAVMGSHAFQEWWQARQDIHPVPSDPFRAFMIDIGLEAKIHRKEVWRGRTHRADYPTIDLPSGVPAPKRRLPSRKEERRFKPVPSWAMPYGEKTELEKGLEGLAEQMSEKYHVPKPRIHFERGEGALGSAYFAGEIGILQPFIKVGVKGKSKPQIFGAFEHEFGHHAHAKIGLPLQAMGVSTEFRAATSIEREQKAWKFADPFMQQRRQEQKWLKQFALGTYTGKVKPLTVQRSYGILGIKPLRKRRS